MKKCRFIIVCVFSLLVFAACNSNRPYLNNPNILSITREDFDIETAIDMVKTLERPILYLQDGNIITRDEIDDLRNRYDIFSDQLTNMSLFFAFVNSAEYTDQTVQVFELIGVHSYPTIFDEEIEVTSAYVETTAFEIGDTMIILNIVQDAVSGDLAGSFRRIYQFEPDSADDWQFRGIGGTINYWPAGFYRY